MADEVAKVVSMKSVTRAIYIGPTPIHLFPLHDGMPFFGGCTG